MLLEKLPLPSPPASISFIPDKLLLLPPVDSPVRGESSPIRLGGGDIAAENPAGAEPPVRDEPV